MHQTAEEYQRRMNACIARADLASSEEIHAFWLTIAGSYRFLLERDEQIEAHNLRPRSRPWVAVEQERLALPSISC